MILAAFVTFTSFFLLLRHLSPRAMLRVVGYCALIDLVLHATILWMFLGTSTQGLLQAEAAGICFSLYLRGYRWLFGYERLTRHGWQRYAGQVTRRTSFAGR